MEGERGDGGIQWCPLVVVIRNLGRRRWWNFHVVWEVCIVVAAGECMSRCREKGNGCPGLSGKIMARLLACGARIGLLPAPSPELDI